VRQQLVACAERVLHGRLVGRDNDIVAGHLGVVENEATADGVERPLRDHGPAGVKRPKHHGVRVEPLLLGAVQDDVVGQIEPDRMLTEQRQHARAGDGVDPLGRQLRVDRVRPLAHQAERDGRDAPVPLAGRPERSAQFHGDALDGVEPAVLRQATSEAVGGDHRADGV